jgi:hypothetical protein
VEDERGQRELEPLSRLIPVPSTPATPFPGHPYAFFHTE